MAKSYLDDNGLLYFWQKIKNLFAPKDSPVFTGMPKAPTASSGDNSTQIATTAFVADAVGSIVAGVEDVKIGGTSVVTDGIANIPGSEAAVNGGTDLSVVTTGEKYTWDKKANDATFSRATSSSSTGRRGLVPAPPGATYSHFKTYVLTSYGLWGRLTMSAAASSSDATKQIIGLNVSTTDNSPVLTVCTPSDASPSMNGFMSIADKVKLDSIIMSNGIIDASVLPSFVDDVIEAYAISGATALAADWLSETSGGTALTPEAGKIYVLMADSGDYSANTQFRWGGSAYVKLNDGGVTEITNSEIDTIVAS